MLPIVFIAFQVDGLPQTKAVTRRMIKAENGKVNLQARIQAVGHQTRIREVLPAGLEVHPFVHRWQ